MYASPALVMRPSRVLPPELYCPGTRPSQAANWRPHLNSCAVADHRHQRRGGGLADARAAASAAGRAVRRAPSCATCGRTARCARPGRCNSLSRSPMTVLAQPGRSSRCGGLAAHGVGLQRQHDAELGQQPADAVDAWRCALDEPLARAVHHQPACCSLALDRHEAHVRALHGFADRRRVGGVVLAALAAHAVRARRTSGPSAARCGRGQ